MFCPAWLQWDSVDELILEYLKQILNRERETCYEQGPDSAVPQSN